MISDMEIAEAREKLIGSHHMNCSSLAYRRVVPCDCYRAAEEERIALRIRFERAEALYLELPVSLRRMSPEKRAANGLTHITAEAELERIIKEVSDERS